MSWLQGLSVASRLIMGNALPRFSRAKTFNPLWNHYRCADDRWLAFAMAQADRFWPDFARALGHAEWVDDERFATMMKRGVNAGTLIALLDEVFASQPSAEWMKRLDAGGDFIFTIVNAVADLPDDPQMRANDLIAEVEHPEHGKIEMLNVPIGMSKSAAEISATAPELGQHTEQILVDELGYDWDEIGALRDSEVI
jgi:crotonobetainyl-CoA:carnitine CoA-transferase CaiB-like acyl-CoA transferase